MIWAILVLPGVPLWLCALAILVLVIRNRSLRKREGDVVARVRMPGKTHWTRGHGLSVSDVFMWRGSPAAWRDHALWTLTSAGHRVGETEKKKLHFLGDAPVIVALTLLDGGHVDVAARGEQLQGLLGPFGEAA